MASRAVPVDWVLYSETAANTSQMMLPLLTLDF
jgi:hypothetical protein